MIFHTGTKTSKTEYDDQGNIKKDTDINGNVTVYTYNNQVNPNLVTKEKTTKEGTLLSDTNYTYDSTGRVTEEEDFIGNQVSLYTYTDDAEGIKKSTIKKEEGQKVSTSKENYDVEGNLLTEENEIGGIETSSENEYDEMGNLLKTVNSDGSKTVYTYDFIGRVLKEQSYDKDGEIIQTKLWL